MSFKDVILPPFVIADLYNNKLIDANEPNVALADNVEQKAIKFLGDNKKKISIIVSDVEAVYVTDDKLDFLSKILAACKLSLADVAIINISNTTINYNDIKQNFDPKEIILFGINARNFKLPLVFPEYRIQEYNNTQMLIVYGLEKYLQNDAQQEKRKLWECLKTLFNV